MKDITPNSFSCHTDDCCPAVLDTKTGSYLIIGKKVKPEDYALIADRIASDEYVVEIPKGLIDELPVMKQ